MVVAEGRVVGAIVLQRTAEYFILIVIRFIDPGVPAGEATPATVLGQRFTREPSETEDDLIDRVHDCAKANRPAGQRAVRAFLDDEFER